MKQEKSKMEIRHALRPYGCQFDGTETLKTLKELHRILIEDPAKEEEQEVIRTFLEGINYAARYMPGGKQ